MLSQAMVKRAAVRRLVQRTCCVCLHKAGSTPHPHVHIQLPVQLVPALAALRPYHYHLLILSRSVTALGGVQLAAARAAATTWLQQECPEAWEDRYGREPRKGADILVQVSTPAFSATLGAVHPCTVPACKQPNICLPSSTAARVHRGLETISSTGHGLQVWRSRAQPGCLLRHR